MVAPSGAGVWVFGWRGWRGGIGGGGLVYGGGVGGGGKRKAPNISLGSTHVPLTMGSVLLR